MKACSTSALFWQPVLLSTAGDNCGRFLLLPPLYLHRS